MHGFEVWQGLSGVVDDSIGSGGCGFDVRWVCRRINAAAMFRYGDRGGEREGLGKFRWPVLEVRLGGLNFFSEGFRSYICSEGKNDEKNPHPPSNRRPYEGRRGIWRRIKYLYLVGGSFAAEMEF